MAPIGIGGFAVRVELLPYQLSLSAVRILHEVQPSINQHSFVSIKFHHPGRSYHQWSHFSKKSSQNYVRYSKMTFRESHHVTSYLRQNLHLQPKPPDFCQVTCAFGSILQLRFKLDSIGRTTFAGWMTSISG